MPGEQRPAKPANPYEGNLDVVWAWDAWDDGFERKSLALDACTAELDLRRVHDEGGAARDAYDAALEAARKAGVPMHTPGPWQGDGFEPCPNAGCGMCYAWIAAPERLGGGRVAQFFQNCLVDSEEELRANVAVAAAAPDLLATLLNLDKWLMNAGYDSDHPWRISIRATTDKAAGRAA